MIKTIFNIIILSSLIFAQNITVTGKVTNEDGKPLSYCNVLVKELKIKTSTNRNGRFKIKDIASGDYTFIVSHLGYKTFSKRIPIKKNKTEIKITLTLHPINLGEAIVISTKTPETEKNLSLPVETETERNLGIKVSNTIADALRNKAGIDVARDGAWATMINVRGLSKQNLVYLIDGVRIETSTNIAGGLSLFDLNNIEKIEVVKGGLSSLYGSGATGGVVNIISKSPEFSENFYLSGNVVSSYKTVNKGFSNGLNLFSGGTFWKAKLSATSRKASDTKIPDGYLTNSGFRDYAFSGNLGIRLFSNSEANVEYQLFRANNVGIPGGAAFPPGAKATYVEALRKLFSANFIFRNPFPFMNTLTVKYFNQLIRRNVRLIPKAGVSVEPNSDHKTLGATIQSEFTFGKNFLIAGIDAWKRTYEGMRYTINYDADVIIIDKPVPNSEFGSFGIFANDEYFISEKLKMNFGARYDFIKITNEETENPLMKIVNGDTLYPPPIDDASFPREKNSNSAWSGNLNILYKITPKLNLALSLSETFRSPSLEERYQYINLGGIVYLGNPSLNPEKSRSFNFGLRFSDKRFSVKSDFFANFFNDLVIDKEIISDSLYRKTNVGKARYYGFDISFQTKICKSLINGTISYVSAKNTETNEPLPQIPPLNGMLEFTAPILNSLDFTLRGKFYANKNDVPVSEERTPGYAVYDLIITSRLSFTNSLKLNISGGIENLLNRKYRNHLSTYRGISLTEPARNFYLKIKINFNY